VVDRIVLARPAAAERHDREAHGANVDRAYGARLAGLRLERDRRAGKVALRRLEEVGGAPELAHHRAKALGRCAAVERLLGRAAGGRLVRLDATQHQQLGAERERDFAQAIVARSPGQVVDRLAHLHRVAGTAAEHSIHVREQRRCPQAVAVRHLHDRASELLGLRAVRQEGAGADLHVHHERVEARGELLREDRCHDQGDRLDRPGGVADRV
jgi:hypothetical protein